MVNLAGIVSDRHRQVIHAIVEEITAQPVGESGLIRQLMPVTNVPFAVLEHETISGFGGFTLERVINAPGESIAGISSKSKLYEPGAYQEHIPFTEKDLLALRKFGTHIGLAFQIRDDILDVVGDKRKLGKKGSDRANQKLTYPALCGLGPSDEKAQKLVKSALNSLKIFGKRASILRELALYTLQRDH